jgi:integrase
MIYKRGSIYWTKFQDSGRMIYKSTGQTSATKARQLEARLRSELAMGNFGILAKKAVPTLAEFCVDRVEPWAKSTFEQASPKTWLWYKFGLDALKKSATLRNFKLDEIGPEAVAEYASERQRDGLQISSVNSCLRCLRRVLRLAEEWNVLTKAPRVKFLAGEHCRDRVLSPQEESLYLNAAQPLLHAVSVVLFDTGVRPEECHRMRWEHITWVNGRHGTVRITHGKSKAAKRILPMTPRFRQILEARWIVAGQPEEGWVWPAPTQCGHINHDSLKRQHRKALRISQVRPFEVYSIRHTFATRLAPHVDPWTLMRIMGWSSIAIAMRYVHMSDDRVLGALASVPTVLSQTGDKTGDSVKTAMQSTEPERLLTETSRGS